MAISKKKMKIVIDNYFKSECNVDTSIRDAFEKGFRIGVQKTANRPTGEWQKVDEQPYFRKHFDNVCCSVCHHKGMRKYNFCPNCGADMRGGDDE